MPARSLRVTAALAGLLLAGGCAWMPNATPATSAQAPAGPPPGAIGASAPAQSKRAADASASASASATASAVALAKPPPLRLTVVAPPPLKALLEQHLDLARLHQLPADEALNPQEWARLVAGAPAQVRELLQTEGYFDAQVRVEREGVAGIAAAAASAAAAPSVPSAANQPNSARAVAAVPPAATALPAVRVVVEPGPRTQVVSLSVKAQGAVADRAARGEDEAQVLTATLPGAPLLQVGKPFRNPDWAESKQQVLTRLRAGGYAAAGLAHSRADIDADRQQARLLILADSGPLFLAGPLAVAGLVHQDESTVRHLAGFDAGTPLTEARLMQFQERLQKSGLYQSASVSFDPDRSQASAAPVRVQLSEAPLQQATVGLGINANTGPRATLEHTHRRPLDWPVVAHNQLEWARDRQSWNGDFQTHPGPGFVRHLVGVQIVRELSDTDAVLSQRLRAGRTQDVERIERLYFIEWLRSRQSPLDPNSSAAVSTAAALTANLHFVWRQLDSVLLPTRGLTVALQAGAGQAQSASAGRGPVGRLYGRVTGYLPLGQRWYGTARLELGQVFKRNSLVAPDALGFRAGGDDSVRGYGYRNLAPTDGAGNTVSGDNLATASLEVARPLSEQMPQLWGALFVDAGRATQQWQGFSPALGYGVGLRWRSPVGPLRMDLAYGDELRRVRLHLSVGIAF